MDRFFPGSPVWWKPQTSNERGTGSIPGRGTKFPQAGQHSPTLHQKKRRKKGKRQWTGSNRLLRDRGETQRDPSQHSVNWEVQQVNLFDGEGHCHMCKHTNTCIQICHTTDGTRQGAPSSPPLWDMRVLAQRPLCLPACPHNKPLAVPTPQAHCAGRLLYWMWWWWRFVCLVMSDSLRPHGL